MLTEILDYSVNGTFLSGFRKWKQNNKISKGYKQLQFKQQFSVKTK